MIVKETLEEFGATFESLDDVGKDLLRKYSNASKHDGMMKIWGDHMKEFRNFCDNFVIEYEKSHEQLPKVNFGGGPSKTEGMRDFICSSIIST